MQKRFKARIIRITVVNEEFYLKWIMRGLIILIIYLLSMYYFVTR